ncbi:Ribosomal protein S18 acetylase RimI [Lachnospiraceae bacterium NE2001]|nr:Ribosomal protein S18 acetylase RimI [Lachnospiraceae bacterium NE2001]
MIEYKVAGKNDIELMMSSRLEMLREVNNLEDDYVYSEEFVEISRKYFLEGDQTTVLALDGQEVIGCVSISYITVMPTYDHPYGKRAHLMNVYTRKAYRGQGIAKKMCQMLIDEAWARGVTEISLDTTKAGRPLYASIGFNTPDDYMTLYNR